MFTDRRVLFAIAALIAVGTADAPASPIHRCQQHGCTAHERSRSDLDGPHSAQFGWRYVHHSLVVGSFSGRVMYSSLGRGFSADPAVSRAVDARTW
jgi:hypothetical protein